MVTLLKQLTKHFPWKIKQPKNPMDIRKATQAVKVDDRISLACYLQVADNLLQQANIFRDEEKIIDLYIILLRFCSLISESIPFHQDYNSFDRERKRGYMKKLLSSLQELDELKPKVQQEINKLNKFNASNYQSNQRAPHNSEASSSETPAAFTNDVSSNLSPEQQVWCQLARPSLEGPLSSTNAQDSAEHVEVPMQNNARISLQIPESVSYPDSRRRIFRPSGSYHRDAQKSQGASSSGNRIQNNFPWSNMNSPATEALPEDLVRAPAPSAPPIDNLVMDDALIHLNSISSSSNESFAAMAENTPVSANERREGILAGALCSICMDAPTEGACVPCGHMAGCMTCLNEIKEKNGGCPVCRAKIEMVLRLFAV